VEVEFLDGVQFDQNLLGERIDEEKRCGAAIGEIVDGDVILRGCPHRERVGIRVVSVADRQRQVRRIG